MSEEKKSAGAQDTSKKAELAITKKKTTTTAIKPKKKTVSATPATSSDLWQAFDDTFERFRNDFADLLFPTRWFDVASFVPEVRVPAVDLEDREKDYLLTAEMPGFKRKDIEIEVQDNSVAITGYAGWKYDEKGKLYICKERACKTFYREVGLPEEIDLEGVTANLTEGILQITLPKKAPKPRRKISVK